MAYKIEIVRKNIEPFGVKCVVCDKTAKEGQWVFKHTIPSVMHVVVHRNCFEDVALEMEELSEVDTLDEEFESIREQYVKGEIINV